MDFIVRRVGFGDSAQKVLPARKNLPARKILPALWQLLRWGLTLRRLLCIITAMRESYVEGTTFTGGLLPYVSNGLHFHGSHGMPWLPFNAMEVVEFYRIPWKPWNLIWLRIDLNC